MEKLEPVLQMKGSSLEKLEFLEGYLKDSAIGMEGLGMKSGNFLAIWMQTR